MGINHQRFIKKYFNRESILFNYVCYRKNTPVLDDVESISTPTDSWRDEIFHREMVRYICRSIPLLVSNLRYYI